MNEWWNFIVNGGEKERDLIKNDTRLKTCWVLLYFHREFFISLIEFSVSASFRSCDGGVANERKIKILTSASFFIKSHHRDDAV